jgi:glycosyltransferase involved in cell wall biosynthesis
MSVDVLAGSVHKAATLPEKPALLAVFYANPDRYPPTYNALMLLRERFRVHLVCRLNDEPPGVTWPDDVRVERVGDRRSFEEKLAAPAAHRLRELGGFAWAVRRALWADQPAVVYAYEPYALAALGLAGCRAKIIYQRHEVEEIGPFNPRSMKDWILRYTHRLGRRAEIVVFPEKNRAAMYQRDAGDPRPGLIVPNFPLLSEFPAPLEWSPLIEARWRDKILFYRGNLGSGTGVPQMIRALPHLDPACSLRLCGRGAPEHLREMEALAAELGVSARVRYDGFIPSYQQLNRETLAAAVGFVLYQRTTANNEFMATATNKLYEYAACGVPAVVPSFPSYREFFGGESWIEYADPADPASVAEAVRRIFADRARYEERCRAARRAFEERYNFEAVFAPLRDRIVALARPR